MMHRKQPLEPEQLEQLYDGKDGDLEPEEVRHFWKQIGRWTR